MSHLHLIFLKLRVSSCGFQDFSALNSFSSFHVHQSTAAIPYLRIVLNERENRPERHGLTRFFVREMISFELGKEKRKMFFVLSRARDKEKLSEFL